jgi:2-C-methyl-D-erythritol 2,4-cyclodiphosphate synthase
MNADVTVLAEEPRIAPHRSAMLDSLASLLGTTAVNVKATTTEGLGFTGRREGIAAQAIVLVSKT